ncbi:MAG TPA: hypothetical protein VMB51_07860 [Solirubrobacteraceae bacterium]|nr:hypothetical protein [Solirubrobacteraceae bacterium]
MKASRITIFVLAAVSLVLGTGGVAFAAKAPPDPHKVGGTTLSSIALNGKVGTRFTVEEGEELKVSAHWADENGACPECDDFVAVALAGQTSAGCIEDGYDDTESGDGEVDLGPAPEPGTYDIVANFEEVYNCGEYWNASNSTSYPVLVEVKVKAVVHKARADVQHNNGDCGKPLENEPIVGSAKFTRNGNTLTVSYKAKDLEPGHTYAFEFYGNECQRLGTVATFVANAKGVGHVKGSMIVPAGDTEFFVDAFDGEQPNDSFIVTLP